jgi:hypothetical protein
MYHVIVLIIQGTWNFFPSGDDEKLVTGARNISLPWLAYYF